MSETPEERTYRLNKNRGNGVESHQFGHGRQEEPAPVRPITVGGPPTNVKYDGGELKLTSLDNNVYLVFGDRHTAEIKAGPGSNVEDLARSAYDSQILASLRQAFDNAGSRGSELAEQINFYEQRLGIAPSAFAHIQPGDSEHFSGSELDDNVCDFIEVQVTDPEDGEEPDIYAEAGVTLNFEDWARERGVDDTDDWLNANQNEIDAWVRANYDDMRLEGGGDEWSAQNLTALVEFDSPEATPRTLADMEAAIVNRSKLVDLHNDLNGAYGTGHLYGFWDRLGIHIDAVADESVEPLSKA